MKQARRLAKQLENGNHFCVIAVNQLKTQIMAESKPVTVNNRELFEGNRILYHTPTQRLVAISDDEYMKIIRDRNVKFLSDLPDMEIECFYLSSDTERVTDNSNSFKVDELEGVGYGETKWGNGLRIYFHTSNIF